MLQSVSALAFSRSLRSRVVWSTLNLFTSMVAVCSMASAAVPIPTNHNSRIIEGTETWSLHDSPHLVSGLITVAVGGRLNIEAGAVVYFKPDGRSGILINGALNAVGAVGAPIYLGTDVMYAHAVSNPPSSSGRPADYWRGIEFQNAQSPSVLERVVIAGALVGVQIGNSVVELTESAIVDCDKAAQVDGLKSLAKIQRSHFVGNQFNVDGLRAGSSATLQLIENHFDAAASGVNTMTPSVFTGMGPLVVSSTNTRYFFTPSGKPVYFTGTHTWPNLIERATAANAQFDYPGYLNLLQANKNNFIRLWSRLVSRYLHYGPAVIFSEPLPWARTGPGNAMDGKPKFDLSKFNVAYFDRLRQRVIDAQKRRIYVSIMLFGGHGEAVSEWEGNPFNGNNNINGINADTNGNLAGEETQTWPLLPVVESVQKDYIRKIIDTVSDLDNVLFEISNESDSSSAEWQKQLISYIKKYEASRGGYLRHPVGMTGFWDANNELLVSSNADWISLATPGFDIATDPIISDPPLASSDKVSIMDSDHLFYDYLINQPARGINWVWKSFTRGHNPILMENLFADSTGGAVRVTTNDAGFVAARTAMADTVAYASKMNLAKAVPNSSLASTTYVLANPGSEYLVYQPQPERFNANIHPGIYMVEWFNPSTHALVSTFKLAVIANTTAFIPPISGPSVLYLKYDSPLSVSVSITSPVKDSTISGLVTVAAFAAAQAGVGNVQFTFDGKTSTTVASAPYSLVWDTTSFVHNSIHTIAAKAVDKLDNYSATSAVVSVKVADATPPAVSITSPANNAVIAPNTSVQIAASATDVSGISKVEFSVNGAAQCTTWTPPYVCTWKIPGSGNTKYTIQAKAYDVANNPSAVTISVVSQ